MTRYSLPGNSAEMSARDLIIFEQGHCGFGSRPAPTVAAMAFAAWLLEDLLRTIRQARRADGPLAMGSAISRMLAGEIVPSGPLATAIAHMTDGAVRPEDWERPYEGATGQTGTPCPGATGVSGKAARLVVEDEYFIGMDHGGPAGDATYCAVLGETPPGPLFGVLKPCRAGSFYEVQGLGLSFRLNESAARALHASLGGALGVAQGRAA